MEQISSPAFPTVIPKCAAITLWHAEEGDIGRDYQAQLRMIGPGDLNEEFSTNFVMTGTRHRVAQRMRGLPISEAGELRFEVRLNGDYMASHVVTVVQADPIPATRETNDSA